MGNCLARTRQHEMLGDYPERDFGYEPPSTDAMKDILKRRKDFVSHWRQSHIFADLDDQEDSAITKEYPQSLDTTCETSLFSLPQEQYLEDKRYRRETFTDEHTHVIAANKRDSITRPIRNPLDRFSGRRHAGALQLRLAKNKYLQLATSTNENRDISPLSMDPSIHTPSFFSEGQASTNDDCLNDEFENSISNGVVWEEYTRDQNVTAVAMSQHSDRLYDNAPIVLAVGTEEGVLVLVEILDKIEKRSDPPAHEKSTSGNFGVELKKSLVGRIRAIDFSPNGSYVVAGGDGCIAYVFKIIRHPETQRLKDVSIFREVERVDRIYAISFSPDSQVLSVGGFDSSVAFGQLGRLQSGESPQLKEVSLRGLVLCLDWYKSKVAVGTSGQNGVAVIDESLQMIHHVRRNAAVEVVRWKPDGSLLVVGDREVVLFDALTFDLVHELREIVPQQKEAKKKFRIKAMCFSPDGTFLAIGGSDGVCHVVESKSFAPVYRLQRPSTPTGIAWGRKFQDRGHKSYLGIADSSPAVVLFKAGIEIGSVNEDGSVASQVLEPVKTPEGDEWVLREGSFRDIEEALEPPPERSRAIGTITSIAFSRSKRRPDSSYLAYVSNDCSLTILSTRDWKLVVQMEFPKAIRSISFSYSNNYLALGGDEGVLYVLSVPNRSMVLNMIYDSPIQTVAFSRHDERLSIGMLDGVLSFLSPNDDWSPCGEIDYSDSQILCQDWCSSFLAVGRADGSVTIFDKEKALGSVFVPVAELSDSSRPIRSISFGTGGRFLVFGGDMGIVTIASREEAWSASQIKLKRQVLATKCSPGGRFVVFTGQNQTLRMIDTLTGDEVQGIRLKYSEIISGNGHVQDLTCVDFSKDGNHIAFGSANGNVVILRGPDWEVVGPPV